MKRIVNIILVAVGCIALGVGVVGTILPVLPATPFLLLAAVCFAKGSERFNRWFTATTLYKDYVIPAKDKKMERDARKKTMIVLALVFGTSILLVPIWYVKIIIALVALFHFYYFMVKVKVVPAAVQEG